MGNILRSPTNIGNLTLSDGSIDDTLYVNGNPIRDISPDLNIGNGTINGTLTQKNLSYNQMIEDFEPNMVAYVLVAGTGVSPTSEQIQAVLHSDTSYVITTGVTVGAIFTQLGASNFADACTNFLAGTGRIQPGVPNKTAVDYLIGEQLARWDINSSDDLSNTFGPASDGAIGLGFKNKLWSPGAASFGVDNEAGDEGYPSESIAAIATGYKTKSKGNQSFSTGYDVEVNENQSFGGGFYVRSYGKQSFTFGEGDIENNKPLVNYGRSFVFGGSSKQSYNTTEAASDKAAFQRFKNRLADVGLITSSQAADNNFVWHWDGNHSTSENNFSIGGYIASNAAEGNTVYTKGVIASANGFTTGNNFSFGWWSVTSGRGNASFGGENYIKDSWSSFALGSENEIRNGDCDFLAGQCLKLVNINRTRGNIRLGRFNLDGANNLFEIGNGTADNARSNAFEITDTGIARANYNGTLPTSGQAGYNQNNLVRIRDLATFAPGGGTKLYKHTFTTDSGKYEIISLSIIPYSTLEDMYSDFIKNGISAYVLVEFLGLEIKLANIVKDYNSTQIFQIEMTIDNGNAVRYNVNGIGAPSDTLSDTVTEL